jgi:chemotaxis methyl-accepting protein methylase
MAWATVSDGFNVNRPDVMMLFIDQAQQQIQRRFERFAASTGHLVRAVTELPPD